MRVLSSACHLFGSHILLKLLGQAHDVCVPDDYRNSTPEVLNHVYALSDGTVTASTLAWAQAKPHGYGDKD